MLEDIVELKPDRVQLYIVLSLLLVVAFIVMAWRYNIVVDDYNVLASELNDCQGRLEAFNLIDYNLDYSFSERDCVIGQESDPPPLWIIDEFLSFAHSFRVNRSFHNESYNCVHFSNDFKALSLNSSWVVGFVRGCNDSICHRWNTVTFDFESQRGEFIDYSNKYPLRQKRWQ